MRKKIVIALGGNALGNTPEEQLKLVQRTAKHIVELAECYDINPWKWTTSWYD